MNYKKSLFIFTIVLFILTLINLFYLNRTLKKYEFYDTDNYLNNVLKGIKELAENNELNYLFEDESVSNDFEANVSLLKGYQEIINNNPLRYEISEDGNINLYAGDTYLTEIEFTKKEKKALLGLLNYTEYELKDVTKTNKDNLYSLEIKALSNYQIYINNYLLSDKNMIKEDKIEDFNEGYNYSNIPTIKTYKVSGMVLKPNIVIKDQNGKEIKYELKDNKIDVSNPIELNSLDDAKKYLVKDFNPLDIAKKWSLYLTNDLNGKNGIYTLLPYLIKGTSTYQRAYGWANTIDIYFTSPHTLKNPPFIDEKMSNFKIYDNNNFVVDVHFTKQMILNNGAEKQDTTNERLSFTYLDGNYRLVNTKSIEGV